VQWALRKAAGCKAHIQHWNGASRLWRLEVLGS